MNKTDLHGSHSTQPPFSVSQAAYPFAMLVPSLGSALRSPACRQAIIDSLMELSDPTSGVDTCLHSVINGQEIFLGLLFGFAVS